MDLDDTVSFDLPDNFGADVVKPDKKGFSLSFLIVMFVVFAAFAMFFSLLYRGFMVRTAGDDSWHAFFCYVGYFCLFVVLSFSCSFASGCFFVYILQKFKFFESWSEWILAFFGVVMIFCLLFLCHGCMWSDTWTFSNSFFASFWN